MIFSSFLLQKVYSYSQMNTITEDTLTDDEWLKQASNVGWSIIPKILDDRCSWDDVHQDFLLKCWRKRGQYSPEKGTVIGWLSMIAHNTAIDSIRSTNRRIKLKDVQQKLYECALYLLITSPVCPMKKEEYRIALALLETLPPRDQEVCRLQWVEEISYTEIAERLKLPLNAVKSILRRSKAKLRSKALEFLQRDAGITAIKDETCLTEEEIQDTKVVAKQKKATTTKSGRKSCSSAEVPVQDYVADDRIVGNLTLITAIAWKRKNQGLFIVYLTDEQFDQFRNSPEIREVMSGVAVYVS